MRMDLSSRLFKLYTSVSYAFHLKTNPSILLRNIEGETSQSISVIQSYLSLVREFLVLSVIFSLLVYVDPIISFSAFVFLGLFVFIFYFFQCYKIFCEGSFTLPHSRDIVYYTLIDIRSIIMEAVGTK